MGLYFANLIKKSQKKSVLFFAEAILLLTVGLILCKRASYAYSFEKDDLILYTYNGFFQYVNPNNEKDLIEISTDNPKSPLCEDEVAVSEPIAGLRLSVPFGLYHIKVMSETTHDTENSHGESPLYLQAYASNNQERFTAEDIVIKNGLTEAYFWKLPKANIGEYGYELCLKAVPGTVSIYSIEIEEYFLWKYGVLFCLFLCFAIIDILFFLYDRLSADNKLVLAALGLMVLFSSLPAFNNEMYSGQDGGYHISRIASMAHEWKNGNFPVRFWHDAFNGYGSIMHIMYPNLFLYIPAFLHILGVPLDICYNLFVIFMNALTCALCFYSLKKCSYKNVHALTGTAIYMLSMYRVTDLYVRSAAGEYTAMAFIPLIICGLLRLYYFEDNVRVRDSLPLIIGLSGIVQSHVLSVEMVIIFLAFWGMLHIRRSIYIWKTLVKAMIITLGCNCFFWVPFLDMYGMDLAIKQGSPWRPNGHGLYLTQLLGLVPTYGGLSVKNSTYQEMPLIIGGAYILGIVLFAVCYLKREDWFLTKEKMFRANCILFILGILACWMASVYFPWGYLCDYRNFIIDIFTAVEFPWRYISLASAFLIYSLVYALSVMEQRMHDGQNKVLQVMAIFLAVMTVGEFYCGYTNTRPTKNIDYMMQDYAVDKLYNLVQLKDISAEGFWEQEINKSDKVEIKSHRYENGKNYFELENYGEEKLVSFPVQAYKYIYARNRDTGIYYQTNEDENGRLEVNIPAGFSGGIEIAFKEPVLWRVSEIISLIATLGIIAYGMKPFLNRENNIYE